MIRRVVPVVALGLAISLAACGKASTTDQVGKASTTAATTTAEATTETRRASDGCMGESTRTPGLSRSKIKGADGVDHPYRIFEPDVAADEPTPLLLDLPGLTEPIDFHAESTQAEAVAGGDGATVVTPQGTPNPYRWNPVPGPDNPDVALLRSLIDDIAESHCIDLDRIYVQGISNGGMMSGIISCELDDVVAAVGLVSGMQRGCEGSDPVPAIVFWGELDPVLPYSGGVGEALLGQGAGFPTTVSVRPGGRWSPAGDFEGFPPVEVSVSRWAADNGCAPEPTSTMAGEHVELHRWTGCRNGADVEFYVVTNGGHTWPGSKKFLEMTDRSDPLAVAVGVTTDEIDASELIWEFFKAHPRSAAAG